MSSRFRSKGENQREIPGVPFEQCHAKTVRNDSPGASVLEHCLSVGHIGRILCKYFPDGLGKAIQVNAGLTAGLHDVGKVSPGFQLKYFRERLVAACPALAKYANGFEANHACVSEAAICQRLSVETCDDPLAKYARIAGFHHGRRQEAPTTDTGEIYGGPSWSRERQRLIQALESEFGPLSVTDLLDWQLHLLAGLVCVADWIGSDESYFPPEGLPNGADIDALAKLAVTGCGWKHLPFKQGLSFKDVFGWPPYPLQQDFINQVKGPGLYVLEAPMGLGKTEAALYAAYKVLAQGQASGLYFGLPTRLTSDKMHERVADFLNKISADPQPVRLAHGNAWLEEYGFAEIREDDAGKTTWFHPRKRALLYPFTVGTIDQALLGVIRVKHFFVRQFGLAGKVVILDEVHSYDQYTGTLLDTLVQRLLDLKCTVIVLSATLTHNRRSRLIGTSNLSTESLAYPSVTAHINNNTQTVEPVPPPTRTVHLAFENWQPSDLAHEAVKRAEHGQCVLCIANSVAQAQQWHNHIQGNIKAGSFDVGLLHSKFLGWRRDELEREWISKLGKNGDRPVGCILGATQIVEQSIDIDADAMITELAPSDMLLQRIGRLWRHNRPLRPAKQAEVTIVTGPINTAQTEDDLIEALGKVNTLVYSGYVLWRTYHAWSQLSSIRIPDKVRDLLEQTYAEQTDQPDYIQSIKQTLDKRCDKLIQHALSARASVQGMPTMSDNEDAPTRYSDRPMTDVLIVTSLDSTDKAATLALPSHKQPVKVHGFDRNIDTLKCLYHNMLSIPTFQLPANAIGTPLYLRKYFFDAIAVLVLGSNGELTFDNKPTGFRYDTDRGLQRIATTALPKNTVRLNATDDTETYAYSDYDNQEDTFYESSNW